MPDIWSGTPPTTLDELVQKMYELTDDPLAVEGTRMVTHRGNPEAKLMVIGEAPGHRENEQGKPFVGPSGKLLGQILESVDFHPEDDVFVTNAVFRLPPSKEGKSVRKPTPAEIDYYRPYLMEIIRLIDPKIILLTGAVSMQSILRERRIGITKMRGQWHEIDGRWVMPIFHPAYLLRNPSKEPGKPKSLMWQDVQEVRRKFDELELAIQ